MKLLIQACGNGTRLWPLSKKIKPKQFTELNGKSFILRTKERFSNFISDSDVFYSILEGQEKNLIKATGTKTPQVLYGNPTAKENSSNILLAIFQMLKNGISENETIVMTWSDLFIKKQKEFSEQFKFGLDFIEQNPEKILLTGVIPEEASTAFGYIKFGKEIGERVFEIASFKEKPNQEVAQEYFEDGNFAWNSGIFIFKLGTFWKEAKSLNPELCELIIKAVKNGEDFGDFIGKQFDQPVDTTIFEKSKNLACLKTEGIAWNDVGNFESLHKLSDQDKDGNYFKSNGSKLITRNSSGNFIISESKNILLNGVKNLVIIEDGENLVILDKNDASGLKNFLNKTNL